MWDMKQFFDQAAKEYVGFWDVKSVSKQAAYYMEWRGPPISFDLSLLELNTTTATAMYGEFYYI